MRASHAGLTLVAAALTVLVAGCGGPSGSAAPAGGAVVLPPRPGEDAMKEQMEKMLQKKGRFPKGVPDPRKK